MNNNLIQQICEMYNFNVGNALFLLIICEDSGNKLNSLEAAKMLIKREIEFERYEYSVNPKDYNLPQEFDSTENEFENYFESASKNVYSAIYELYGFYDKKRLLKCLEYIDNEIFTLI